MTIVVRSAIGACIAMAPYVADPCSAGPRIDCEYAVLANAVALRGSVVCDAAWANRKGARVIRTRAEACADTPRMKSLVIRGFQDFDRKVNRIGKASACEELDELLEGFE